MPEQEKTWTTCSICGASMLAKNLKKHMRKVHGQAQGNVRLKASTQRILGPVRIFNRETVKCSVCGAMVKRSGMEQHIRTAHAKPAKTDSPRKKPSPGNQLVECDICGASVRRDRLKPHQSRVHGGTKRASVARSKSRRRLGRDTARQHTETDRRSSREDELVRCKTCGVFVESVLLDSHECKDRPHRHVEASAQIILYSDRCRKIRSGGLCSECGFPGDVVWRYRDSNQGIVQLCRECQPKVLDRSFGSVDAMERSWISSFETSRRRH